MESPLWVAGVLYIAIGGRLLRCHLWDTLRTVQAPACMEWRYTIMVGFSTCIYEWGLCPHAQWFIALFEPTHQPCSVYSGNLCDDHVLGAYGSLASQPASFPLCFTNWCHRSSVCENGGKEAVWLVRLDSWYSVRMKIEWHKVFPQKWGEEARRLTMKAIICYKAACLCFYKWQGALWLKRLLLFAYPCYGDVQ